MARAAAAKPAEPKATPARRAPAAKAVAPPQTPQTGFWKPDALEKLGKALDWDRVKKKPGQGSFDYIGHADIRRTANDIFGYDGWGYTTDSVTIVAQGPMIDDGREGVQACAISTVTLEVRLADGSWLRKGGTGEGTGNGYNKTALVDAPGKAAKEAESDALKRAFINLGDQFALILYAKDEERTQLQAEAEARESAVEANAESMGQLRGLANAKGQAEFVDGDIKKETAEFGFMRQIRADVLIERLLAMDTPKVPDALVVAAEVAAEQGGSTSKQEIRENAAAQAETAESRLDAISTASMVPELREFDEKQRAVFVAWDKDGDSPAEPADIEACCMLAAKVSPEACDKAIGAIIEHRAKYEGIVSKGWLRKLARAILESAKAGSDGELVMAGNPSEVEGQAAAEAAASEQLGATA